jgi:hypothetical protein
MRKLIYIVATLVLVVAGWAVWRHHVFNQSKIRTAVTVQSFESDLTEALARQMFGEIQAEHPGVYFLAFGEPCTSPSLEFLNRFHDVSPQVKSFRAVIRTPNGLILDQATGRTGVIVQVVKVAPFVADTYDVTVTLHKSGKVAELFTCRMTKIAGEWTLKSRKPA